MIFKRTIIEEICNEKGIELTDISYGWITILKKGDIQKTLINNNFYLNTRNSVELANDKYATYELLNYNKIPIIKHNVLFNETFMPEYSYVNDNYNILKNDDKVVIKANDSSQGKDVYVCETQERKMKIVNHLMKTQEAVIVCPYKDIEFEYRLIYLYGEVVYIYKKEKPYVIGDGVKNVKQLIDKDLEYLNEPLPNLDFDYIPKVGEKIIVGWKHNLSNRAIPRIIDERDFYYDSIKSITLEVGKVMNLNFASIDVVVAKDQEVYVMEVNSNVTITKFCELVENGYEIGKQIYSKVIDKMFEN